MLGSAAFRTGIAPGGALSGPWVRNPLWTLARAVPSLDLRFSDNKSLVDATTGASLVTFTRASTGTYVGSDGLIMAAVTNLQTWSEDFRNTADAGATRPWTYNTSAVTADNTIAPNGTSTADLIAGAAGTANKFLSNNISTTTTGFYTFSLYLKQNSEQFVVLRLTDGSANGIRGRFDLTAGTVVVSSEGTATGQAASATAVGNGWYRCVVTCSLSSLPSSVMQPQLWLNNFASTSLTTNYFAWGAQLEQSSTVGEYIPTTSTINSAPRFDHNPTTGESLGLLVEEARTNLLLNSATLSTQSVTVAAAANTLSFYGTGTVTLTGVSTAGPLVGTGANNRVSLTFTPTVGVLVVTVLGSVTNAQLESGAFATSYIPTTTATVTRAADVASVTGSNFSSFYNQTEGTVFADVNTAPVANIAQALFDLSEGAGNERMFQRRTTGGFISTAITDNSVVQGDFGSVQVSASGRARSGFAYRLNDFEAAVNGSPSGTDTSATVPTPDRIHIGQNFGSGQVLNGTIKRLTYWPVRLTNPTLQSITTP